MSRLQISMAVGDYDRTRPLVDGRVQIDGVDAVGLQLVPEEMFFRAFRHEAFDVSELSFSSYCVKLAQGDCPYVAIPAFVSRAFRHTSIWVRRDRVASPQDLKGRRIGIPEWQLTAIVWARALLADDFGVLPTDVTWVRGGIDEPGRPEKIALQLPPEIRIESAPEGDTLSAMLERGDIDGFIAPRPPSRGAPKHPDIGWLFPDPTAAAKDYWRRTAIFPVMHVVGVRRTLVDRLPWLPATLMKAFERAKAVALEQLSDTSATKVTLPFVEEQLAGARALMGPDFWSYGVPANRPTLEAFVRHHHAQGLSKRLLSVDELFHPSTYEAMKI
jgi:4,5-dihydroxyphthalate decarboxylase